MMTGVLGLDETTAVADAHARRSEKLLLYSVCFFRFSGLLQIGVVLTVAAAQHRSLGPVAALATGVAAESLLLMGGCARRGRLMPVWITVDVLFYAAALILNAQLTLADPTKWAKFIMYAFTMMVSSVAIGLTYRRLSTVLAMTALLATGYTLSQLLRSENDLPNTISYFAAALPAWAVARELRRSARAADASHAQAMARASELAIERERTHYARMLHDRVLQTLETLSNGGWIADPDLRAHVAAEASWLRAVVQGLPVNQPRDLLSVLQSIVQDKARNGLRVEFNEAGLRAAEQLRSELTPALIEAVAGAVREALTNVIKHAGVDTAVVRATLDTDLLTISVLDHGVGFNSTPATTSSPQGIGLTQSVCARIEEIGGTVQIDSTPGIGTHVDISIPAPTRTDRRTDQVNQREDKAPQLNRRRGRTQPQQVPELQDVAIPR
jgi:signal transduction histidine kinase